MAVLYPSGIDTSTSIPPQTDLISPVQASVTNTLREAVIAIENELGIAPSGAYGTVRDRLDAITLAMSGLDQGVEEVQLNGTTIIAPANILNFTGSVNITDAGDCTATIEILTSGGTVTGASNIGSGADIFSADVANVLQFRGVSGTDDISTTVNGDNVEVSGAALLPLDGDRSMTGDLNMGSNAITNVTTINSIDITDHNTRHENGGADEISVDNLSGELADPQKVSVRVNSGAVIGSRKRLNFIPSSDISISAADDGSEIDISFSLDTATTSTIMYQDIFSASPGQTIFNLTAAPVGQQYVEMYINGVSQTVGASYDYTVVDDVLTFVGSVVLEGGEEVVIRYFKVADVTGVVTTGMYQEAFTATAGQTEFVVTHLPISQEYVEMFIDGLSKIEGVDYTTDGYTVTYSDSPSLSGGEIVSIKYFTQLSAADIRNEIKTLIDSGAIDGYNMELVYVPNNYVAPVNDVIGEHIAGIDDALGNHATNHEVGGGDEISVEGLSGTLADPQNVVVAYSGTPVGTRGNINFVPGANIGITVGDNTTGSRVDVTVAASVTALPSVAISAGTNTANSGTVIFSNSNGISFGMNTNSVVTASFSQTPVWFSIGTNSRSSGTVQFSNSNGVSFGMNTAGVVTASVNAAAGGVVLSAGTNSTNTGTVVFSNANGISFGMNTAGVITASTTQASQVPIWISAGTSSKSSGTVRFSNSNGISFGMATNGVITASVGAGTAVQKSIFGEDFVSVKEISVSTGLNMFGVEFFVYSPVSVSEAVFFNQFSYINSVTIRPFCWATVSTLIPSGATTSESCDWNIYNYNNCFIGLYKDNSLIYSTEQNIVHYFGFLMSNTASRTNSFLHTYEFWYYSNIQLGGSVTVRQGGTYVSGSLNSTGSTSRSSSIFPFGNSFDLAWYAHLPLNTTLGSGTYNLIFIKGTQYSSSTSSPAGSIWSSRYHSNVSLVSNLYTATSIYNAKCFITMTEARPDYLIGSSDTDNVILNNHTFYRSVPNGTSSSLSIGGVIKNYMLPIIQTTTFTSLPSTISALQKGNWESFPLCLIY